MYNLVDEDKAFAKRLRKLRKSNAEVRKSLKKYKRDYKSINLLEQNKKVFAQINKNLEENATCMKQNLKKIKKVNKISVELNEKYHQIYRNAMHVNSNLIRQLCDLDQGLRSQTIEKFPHFTADQSHVGDQCAICMEDFEIGRNMMRLDCDGKHAFCQVCIEGWFADHKTCPLCRHDFSE